mmetsp:Transcript_647/g.1480  ORF Transcript_647/g.1480 Transcript_647/m.1480 type:complete len:200 (+) Transcript_647:1943-2542(+)
MCRAPNDSSGLSARSSTCRVEQVHRMTSRLLRSEAHMEQTSKASPIALAPSTPIPCRWATKSVKETFPSRASAKMVAPESPSGSFESKRSSLTKCGRITAVLVAIISDQLTEQVVDGKRWSPKINRFRAVDNSPSSVSIVTRRGPLTFWDGDLPLSTTDSELGLTNAATKRRRRGVDMFLVKCLTFTSVNPVPSSPCMI